MQAGTVYSTEKTPIRMMSFSSLSVLPPSCFITVRIFMRENKPSKRKRVPTEMQVRSGVRTSQRMLVTSHRPTKQVPVSISPSTRLIICTMVVMMAGTPQAMQWNHWDCESMASCPHFNEADRNQQIVSMTHQVLAAMMKKYLGKRFSLDGKVFPHQMRF